MAVNTKPRPRTNSKAPFWIALVILAVIIVVLTAVIVLREASSGAASVLSSVSNVTGNLAESANTVNEGLTTDTNKVLKADTFIRVQDDFVLRQDDLTGSYYVPEGGEARLANSTLLYDLGELEAKRYITATGRVDGWQIQLRRSNNAQIAPAVYNSRIDVFENVDGAELAFSEDYRWAFMDQTREPVSTGSCSIGSECVLLFYDKFDPATGLTTHRYEVGYRYHNVIVWVTATGLDVEVTQQDALDAAQVIFNRLNIYPLVSPE